MKKLLLSLLVIVSFLTANAQADTTLQKFTGKYKFPDGSPVTEITVAVDKEGTLTASSAMGTTELKKTDTENVFEVVAYSGIATFKKNAEGKVVSVQIVVGDLNMEGTKAEGGSSSFLINFKSTDHLY
jgi:hypothetical protein